MRHRGKHHGDQHSRPVRQQASQQEDQGGGARANRERGRADGRQRLTEHRELGQQLSGFGTGQFQAAEILELAGKDRDRNPAGEADGHGVRNVANERTEPQQADQGQHEPGEEDREQKSVEAEFGDGSRHKNDERAGGPADLVAAAAQGRYQEAANDGGI